MKIYWRYESIPELDGVSAVDALTRYKAARRVALRRHGRGRWFLEQVLACTVAGFGAALAPLIGVWGGVGAFFGGALGAALIVQREIRLVRPVLQANPRNE